MNNAVIVFTRYPTPGVVKTRLAQSIGDAAAAQFYKSCVEHVIEELRRLPDSVAVHLYLADSNDMNAMRSWIGDSFTYHSQSAGDLGERMQTAFREVFADGVSKAVIVGTDIPDLTQIHILTAFQLLNRNDVVLGPAIDGGYYLLGTTSPQPLFEGIEWGSDSVAHSTRKIIFARGLSLAQLEMLEDIDTDDSYRRRNFLFEQKS